MSRPLRIQYPGALYHVMNRGNARQKIFKHPNHYNLFLKCLKEAVEMWELKLHAFSLLPNHYHLLIETPLSNLSRAMRHVNHVYTQRLNRRLGRDGHLFRGRYKSILVEEDAYLVELARYIHMNPVRAGLVNKPENHAWTSHRYYLKNGGMDFLTTERILHYFGKKKNHARRKFHKFVLEGIPAELENRLSGGRWPSVLSRKNFEEWVQWNFVKDRDEEQLEYVPSHGHRVSEKALRRIVCRLLDMRWKTITNPAGWMEQRNRARAIWFYRRHLKWGYGDLSREFGVAPSRISQIMKETDLIAPTLKEHMAAELKSEK